MPPAPDPASRGPVRQAAVESPERVADEPARRSVVPPAAGRSLWLAAAWTGAGAAVLCIVASIVAVAVSWLPASGASGNANSAIRAGVLVFLAALHGGITVDGVPTAFVPLGMTMIVGVVAWRAGCGLADAAEAVDARDADGAVEALDEQGLRRLLMVGATQVAVFAVVCSAAAGAVSLGTTSASTGAAFVTGALLFAVTGGVAFVRWSALGDVLAVRLPGWDVLRRAARAATAGVACYLGVGAALVAGALVVHHDRVTALSAQVGGGWSGAPVLVLGVLAAPNAVIAALAYLVGPGFALGSGTHVSLFSTAHGVLPAFPVLGAVPTGSGASSPVLAMAAAAPLLAGGVVAALAVRTRGWAARLRETAVAALLAGLFGVVLAWQGGGAVGSARLSAIGASPWQVGIALGAEIAVMGTLSLGVAGLAGALRRTWRARRPEPVAEPGPLRAALQVVRTAVAAAQPTTPISPAERETLAAQPGDDPVDGDAVDGDAVDGDEEDGDEEDGNELRADGRQPAGADEVTVRLRPDELAG